MVICYADNKQKKLMYTRRCKIFDKNKTEAGRGK